MAAGETDVRPRVASRVRERAAQDARVRMLLMGAGLALYWPFFRHCDFIAFFSSGVGAVDGFLWRAYSIIMAGIAALLVAAVVGRRRVEPEIMRRPGVCVACGLVGSTGYLLFLAAPAVCAAGSVLACIAVQMAGALAVACGYAALILAWMKLLTALEGSETLISMLAACCASCILSLATSHFAAAATVVTVLSPVVSGALWAAVALGVPRTPVEYGAGGTRGLPLLPLAASGLFLAFGRIAQGLFYSGRAQVPYAERLAAVVLTVALLVLGLLVIRARGWERMLGVGWAFLALAFVAGLLMLVPVGYGLGQAGLGVVSASLSRFELLFWVTLVKAVHQQGLSATLVLGLGCVLFRVAPAFAGKVLVPLVAPTVDAAADGFTGSVLLAMTFFLVCATVTVLIMELTSHLGQERNGTVAASGQDLFDADGEGDACGPRVDRLRALAERGRLSPRESEVMRYMAQGYSYQKIADCIGVTLGTAQGYAKNVFRKLDIHTRQELIDAAR